MSSLLKNERISLHAHILHLKLINFEDKQDIYWIFMTVLYSFNYIE